MTQAPPNNQNPIDEAKLLGSFEAFVQHFLDLHGFDMGQIQRDMIDFMVAGHQGIRVHVFRGASKSFLADLYVLWRIWRAPDLKVLIFSAKETNSARHIREIRRLVRLSPLTRHWRFETDNRTTLNFAFAHPEAAPSVHAVSIESAVEGARADLIISDDSEVKVNSRTPAARAWITQRMCEFTNISHPKSRFIPKGEEHDDMWKPELTQVVVIGTYYSQFSVYIPRADGEGHPLKDFAVYQCGALTEHEESTFPERFTTTELLRRRDILPASEWTLQYLLDPEAIGDTEGVIKWSKVVTKTVDPKHLYYTTLCFDPVGERIRGFHKHDGDEMAFAIGGLIAGEKGNKNHLHILEIDGSNKHTSEDFIRNIMIPAIIRHKVQRVQVEANIESAYLLVQRILLEEKVNVALMEPFRAIKNKHDRLIGFLEPNVNAGIVSFEPEVVSPANHTTVYQMKALTHLSLPSGDDRIDALAQLVEMFAKHLAMPDTMDKTYWETGYVRDV